MRKNDDMDAQLVEQLVVLREQPARDPHKAASGRAAFLAQAAAVAAAAQASAHLPEQTAGAVSTGEKQRHNRWMYLIQSVFGNHRKEHSPMFGAISSLLLIVSLVLGGGGITVAAAQNSQPDQGLYAVKTWSENVRADFTANEQARLQLAMEFANRRAVEMQDMLRAGKVPPESVPARMQAEIDLALNLAAGQPEPDAIKNLEQVHEQLQAHEQAFVKMEHAANAQAEPILQQTRNMLHERLELCADGLHDPASLRDRLHNRNHSPAAPQQPSPMHTQTPHATRQATGTHTPGSSYGPGPGEPRHTTGTPTLGSGYGPGHDDGPGEHHMTGTPTPGSSYGPGPGDGGGHEGDGGGDCSGCGDGSGPGSGPGDGSGGSGPGDGSGSGGDSGGDSGDHSGGDHDGSGGSGDHDGGHEGGQGR